MTTVYEMRSFLSKRYSPKWVVEKITSDEQLYAVYNRVKAADAGCRVDIQQLAFTEEQINAAINFSKNNAYIRTKAALLIIEAAESYEKAQHAATILNCYVKETPEGLCALDAFTLPVASCGWLLTSLRRDWIRNRLAYSTAANKFVAIEHIPCCKCDTQATKLDDFKEYIIGKETI